MKRRLRHIILLYILVVCILYCLHTICTYREGFNDGAKPVKIVFVCHSQDSTDKILREQQEDVDVLFVGMGPVNPGPRIIVCRDLEDNIEDEPKLLTFTAWYAIIKNNLYREYSYICIFEYDASISEDFVARLVEQCKDGSSDIISFFTSTPFNGINPFLQDVKVEIVDYMRKNLNTEYEYTQPWNHSSNHCMRREVLQDFVEWYSQQYEYIKERDIKQLSWYHERLFAMYAYSKRLKQSIIDGVTHISLSSHKQTINKE
jgi:hypothetical protein